MSKIVKVKLKDTVNPTIVNSIIMEMSEAYDVLFDKVVVYKKSLSINFLTDVNQDDTVKETVKNILLRNGKNV